MSEWDAHAADWDTSPAVRAYADAALASLESIVDAAGITLEGAALCDFGCGTGVLVERLAGRCSRIDAVDSSGGMLDVLREKVDRHGWTHVRVLDRLPADPQDYRVIVCSSVLGFVDDLSDTVGALVAQLAPGGLFVQWDWERDPDGDAVHGLTRAEVRDSLVDAGLESVVVADAFELTVDDDTMRPIVGSGRRPA